MKLLTWWRRHWWRMAVSAGWDWLDMTVGRIPVFGTVFDAIGGFVGMALWDGIGGIAFFELLDFSDQIDGFIPTLTISGLIRMVQETR